MFEHHRRDAANHAAQYAWCAGATAIVDFTVKIILLSAIGGAMVWGSLTLGRLR